MRVMNKKTAKEMNAGPGGRPGKPGKEETGAQ